MTVATSEDTVILPRRIVPLEADLATRAQSLREQTIEDIITLMVALKSTKQRQADYYASLLYSVTKSAVLLEDVYTPHWRLTQQSYERVLEDIT